VEASATKLRRVPEQEHLPATTVVQKVTFLVIAQWMPSRNPAINAAKKDISPVTVRMALPVSPDLVEVLNVTAAVRLGILLEPAPMLPDPLDTGEEEEEEVTVASAVITKNLATPAEGLATCLATASKAPSATTARV